MFKFNSYFFIFHFIAFFIFVTPFCFGDTENHSVLSKPLWTPEDYVTLPLVEVCDISSDGKYSLLQVFYTVLKEGKNIEYAECILVNNENLNEEAIGGIKQSCDQPQFIKKESAFSYLLGDEKGSTLFVKDMSSKKIISVQKFESAVDDYSFSPDRKKLVYILEQNSYEVINDKKIHPQLFYLQKLDDNFQTVGDAQQVVFPKPHDNIDDIQYDWAPNSQKIAITLSEPMWKSLPQQTLYLMDVESNAFEKIDEVKGGYIDDLSFSSDEEKLVCVKWGRFGQQEGFSLFQIIEDDTIEVFNFKTQKKTNIDAVGIENIVGWLKDSSHLVVIKKHKTKQQLYLLNIETKDLKLIETPHIPFINDAILSLSSPYIAFKGESLYRPTEAYVASFNENSNQLISKKISNIHDKIDLRNIKTDLIHWNSFDGLEIEGILVYPQEYKTGERVPLVVLPHGGPPICNGQVFIGRTWRSSYSPAVFASQGYATLVVNFRGSDGYGKEFINLNYKDLGGGDFKDVMSGVDTLISKEIADPHQLFIGGASYGGFMAAWAIGQTNRFKAAFVESGVVDQISLIALTDFPTPTEALLGGTYWENYDLWRKASPLRYVSNISTPTLILHGEDDARVPDEQALQLHQALQSKKVQTHFVLYKKSDHDLSNPSVEVDTMQEILNWLEIHKNKKEIQ